VVAAAATARDAGSPTDCIMRDRPPADRGRTIGPALDPRRRWRHTAACLAAHAVHPDRPARTARVSRAGLVAVAMLTCILSSGDAAAQVVQQSTTECPDNLLVNPSFEEGFTARARPEVLVAVGWEPWFERLPGIDGINYPPVYAARRAAEDDAGAAFGLWSQEQRTASATHTGGLLQRVTVGRDVLVAASGWVRSYASSDLRSARSMPPGTYVSALGIHPTGGDEPGDARIVWSEPVTVTDLWVPLEVVAEVQGPDLTLLTMGEAMQILARNESRWDGLCLRVLGPARDETGDASDIPTAVPSRATATTTPGSGVASEPPLPAPATREALAAAVSAAARDRSATAAALTAARGAFSDGTGPAETESDAARRAAGGPAAWESGQASGDDPLLADVDRPPGWWIWLSEHAGLFAAAAAVFCGGLLFGLRSRHEENV